MIRWHRFPIGFGYFMLFFVILGEFIFYYLSDFVERGRDFLHLDSYGRGFLTWWISSDIFWGNFWYSTIIALIIASWGLMYFNKSNSNEILQNKDDRVQNSNGNMEKKGTAFKAPLVVKASIIGVCFILGINLIFSFQSPGTGTEFNAFNVLVLGWYPEYFANHFMSFLFLNGGIWLLFFLPKHHQNIENQSKKPVQKNILIISLVGLGLVTIMTLQTSWSLQSVFNINYFALDVLSFLLVILPLCNANMNIVYHHLQRHSPETKPTPNNGQSRHIIEILLRTVLGTIVIFFFVYIYFIMEQPEIPIFIFGIDVGSDWIAKNMMNWLYIVSVATLVYYFGMHQSDRSVSPIPKTKTEGIIND